MFKSSGKFFFWLSLLFFGKSLAQLSGVYNVPGTFTSIAAAVNALNTQGINGAVTIQVNSGYTETAPVGGFSLTATGTAVNPITFVKTGAGSNPLVTAYSGGTATPVSAVQDGIWSFIGSDYVTIDGIDLQDLNGANPATMEYGYGFFKASAADGCQNNLIRNCVIALNRTNNSAGSGPAADGSRGINLVNSLYTSQTSALTPTVAGGANSNNLFYSNTIVNCNVGIALIGYAAPSPYVLADRGNDVGGSGALTGNSILNFGGAVSAVNPAAGVRTLAQYDLRIAYNVINNNTGLGANHVATLRGIYTNAAAGANTSILNNTLTLNSGGATAPVAVIENAAGATANNNTVAINSNVITSVTATLNTSGAFYGIYNNAASAYVLQMNGNVINGLNVTSTTGNIYMVYNTGAVTGTIQTSNNSISNVGSTITGAGAFYGLFNNTPAAAYLDLSSNTFSNCITSSSTGPTHFIYNSSAISNSVVINSNTLTACKNMLNSSGAFYGLFNGGTSAALTISLNSYSSHSLIAGSAASQLIYNTGASTGVIKINNNAFSNCVNSSSAGGSYYSIYNNAASAASLEVNANSFLAYNSAVSTGSMHLIYNRGTSTNTYLTATFDNNIVSNCTFSASSNGPVLGIYNFGVTAGDLSMSGNTITANNWLTTTSTRYFICNTGAVNNNLLLNSNSLSGNTNTLNTTGALNVILNTGAVGSVLQINNNNVTNNYNTATTGGAYLLFNSGQVAAGAITITNNLISSNTNSASGSADFYGIYNQGTTYSSLGMTFNTFSLNALYGGTGATNLLYNTGAATTSIVSISMSNNSVVNNSVNVSSTGSFFGLYNNAASAASLSLSNNVFTNMVITASTGANHYIYNRGAITNTFSSIFISNNQLSGNTNVSSASAPFYSIWNNGITSALTTISNNSVTNSTWNTATGLRYVIANWGVSTNSAVISGNHLSGLTHTLNTTGSLFYIYNNNNTSVSSGLLSIQSNTIRNNQSIATTGETHLINTSGVTSNTFVSISVRDNVLDTYTSTVSGSGAFYGIYNNSTSGNDVLISTNTFSSNFINSATASNYFVHNRGVGGSVLTNITFSNNLFTANTCSMSTSGTWFGLLNSGAGTTSSSSLTVIGNTVSSSVFYCTTAGINLINNACPTAARIDISGNLISDITNTLTTTGAFFAINNGGNSSAGNLMISNNVIVNLNSTASTANKIIIYNNGAISNSISISGNTYGNSTHSVTSSGSFYGIYNNSSGGGNYLGVSANTLSSNSCYALTGTTFLFLNSGVISNTIAAVQFFDNSVQGFTSSATSGPFYGVFNSGFTVGDLAVTTNTLNNFVFLTTAGSRQLLFNNGRVVNSISINNNLLSNQTSTLNTTGAFLGIGNSVSFANGNYPVTLNINNNKFQAVDLSSTNGSIVFMSNSGVATNTIVNSVIQGNVISAVNMSITSGGSFLGVNNTSIASSTLSINSNSLLNVNCNSTLSPRTALFNGGLCATAVFSNNLISGFTSSVNTTGHYFGISNSGNVSNDLNVLNNSILSHSTVATTGSFYPVYNTGGITGTINVVSNQIGSINFSATSSGGFLGIYNNAGSSSALNISSNTFSSIVLSSSNGWANFLTNRAAVVNTITNISVLNNIVSTVSITTNSGFFYGFSNSGSSFSNLSVNSNSFTYVSTSATTSPRYLFNNSGVGASAITFSDNSIVDFSSPANTTGAFYVIYNPSNCSGNLTISGNKANTLNLGSTTGSGYLINNSGIISGSTSIQSNLFSGINYSATNGPFYGVFNGGSSPLNISISNNTIAAVVISAPANARYCIQNSANSANAINLDNNVISGFTSTLSTNLPFYGVYNIGNAGSDISITGNSLSSLSLASTTGTNYMVYNTGTLTGTVDLSSNSLLNCSSNSSGAGTFYGVHNLATACNVINLNNNTLANLNLTVQATPSYLFYNTATSNTVSVNAINLNGNRTDGLNKSSTSSPFYGVFNNLASAANLSLSNNTFTNSVITATSGLSYLVYNNGTVSTQMSLNGNSVGAFTSTLNPAGDFYGVYNSAISQGSISMNSNSFQSSLLDGVSNNVMLVRNNGASTAALSMDSNTLTGCSNSSVTSGLFYGIWNSAAVQGPVSISGNNVSGNSSSATNGNIRLIHNSGTTTSSVSLNNNQLGHILTSTSTDFSGDLLGISNSGGSGSTTLAVNGNSFSGFTFNGLNGSGNIYFIQNSNNGSQLDVSNNVWININLKHNGNEYLIHNPSSTQNGVQVNNNSISGSYNRTGVTGSMYVYHANGTSPSSSSQVFSGNNFSNITSTVQGSGSFYGIYNADGQSSPYPRKTLSNNIISNVNYNGLGFFYGYYFDLLGDGNTSQGSSLNTNTLLSISHAGPLIGLAVGNNCSPNYSTTVYSNHVQSLTCTSQNSEVQAIQLGGTGAGLTAYKNKITDISANGSEGFASGIKITNASATNLYNNLVGNVFAPVTSFTDGVTGISVIGGTQVNLHYNTVLLNASSTGSIFNSSALYSSGSASVNLQNNIFINNSTPVGSGLTCAYLLGSTSLNNYASSSNNNVFYAGIPASNRLIFYNGSPYQNLPAFKTAVAPRESASVSENTNFTSTLGSSANFLHVNATVPSQTESGAQNVGIGDDVDGDIRQGNFGYAGTGTAPDIGADEYDQNLTPCSVVNSGTAIVPSAAINCSGNEVYMVTNGATQAGSISYQWKVAANAGGPYTNVSGGSGANAYAYNTATLNAGTYYFLMVTTCGVNSQTAATNELTVTVDPRPTATASIVNPTLCAGESMSLTANSSGGTSYLWTGPNNFTSTLQNPVAAPVVANSTGVYSLVVSNANCTSNPVFVSALVNPAPPSFTLTPSATSLCIGNSQTLTASIPVTNPTLVAGTQSGQNSASGYPAPYSLYYGGQKMQMLVLGSELAAAGFTTGSPINSIQFPVVSKGANWGSVVNACQNFMVGMKSTTVSSMTGFENGIVNVATAINFTPSVGYSNTHVFTAPFIWDGQSNIIVETVFSNSVVGTSANAVIQNNHPTGYLSTLVYRADNQSIGAVAAATNSNVNVGFVRPDFKLNGTPVGTYTWGPSPGLSSTANTSVVASPTVSTVYTATLSNGNCFSTSSSSVQVILNPTISIATTANTVCAGNNATITATGATSYTWFNNSHSSSLVVTPFGNATYTITGTNPSCPQATAAIQLTSAPALTLVAQSHPSQLCFGNSSTLTASGAATYTWSDNSNNDTLLVTPQSTSSYTISANSGPGCWASKIVNVQVNPLPLITISPPGATVCPGEFMTLQAIGVQSFTWQPGNSNSPILMINPTQSTIYQVTGVDLFGCSNTASATVIVDPCQGLREQVSEILTRIYPNPTNGRLNLQFSSSDQKEITVLNSLAQEVFFKVSVSDTEQLDLGFVARGIYFVTVKQGNKFNSYKLIVE